MVNDVSHSDVSAITTLQMTVGLQATMMSHLAWCQLHLFLEMNVTNWRNSTAPERM